MKMEERFVMFLVLGMVLRTSGLVIAAEGNLRDYNAVIVQDLEPKMS